MGMLKTDSMSKACSQIQKLMSPFIDSMVTAVEAETVHAHVSTCNPCRRQLQALISMRSLLTRMDKPALPTDLILETRVRLSHERNKNLLVKLETSFNNILKPLAIPVIFGISLTTLCFGILLAALASNGTAMAQSSVAEQPVFALYKPVRTTDPTMARFASSDRQTWDEPLMIETGVDEDGRVTEYHIISGPQNAEVNRWIREVLSLAQFTPATAFGKPVVSKIILSFVAVRS
jgi:Putative zinc-finger